jgi:hypothetical protein
MGLHTSRQEVQPNDAIPHWDVALRETPYEPKGKPPSRTTVQTTNRAITRPNREFPDSLAIIP